MIGDFFTKPLGGAKFRCFQNIIMNCSHDDFGPVNMDELMKAHISKIYGVGADTKDVKNEVEPRYPELWILWAHRSVLGILST